MDLSLPSSFYDRLSEFAKLASSDEKEFSNFRQNQALKIYLEYDLPELTANYLKRLTTLADKFFQLHTFRNIRHFLETVDCIGSPDVKEYPELSNAKLSQPTIRYWLWALEIFYRIELYKSSLSYKNINILEIGGGFGGQAAALTSLLKESYCLYNYQILDLPQVCNLINRYIDEVLDDNNNVLALDLAKYETFDKDIDLLISNYAISEFDPETTAKYLPLFSKCKHAFIVWNSSKEIPSIIKDRITFNYEEYGKSNPDIRVIGW